MTTTNIGASARLPDPGPCTDKAHHWNRGNAACNCGGAARSRCSGWAVKSKLSDAEIAALCGVRP